jgi:hypothetical protein
MKPSWLATRIAAAVYRLLLILSLSACEQVDLSMAPRKQDMDAIVASKGVPLEVTLYRRANRYLVIRVAYKDAIYSFDTDDKFTFTVRNELFDVQPEALGGAELDQPQMPIPAWFKAKYPNLNWNNIRIE